MRAAGRGVVRAANRRRPLKIGQSRIGWQRSVAMREDTGSRPQRPSPLGPFFAACNAILTRPSGGSAAPCAAWPPQFPSPHRERMLLGAECDVTGHGRQVRCHERRGNRVQSVDADRNADGVAPACPPSVVDLASGGGPTAGWSGLVAAVVGRVHLAAVAGRAIGDRAERRPGGARTLVREPGIERAGRGHRPRGRSPGRAIDRPGPRPGARASARGPGRTDPEAPRAAQTVSRGPRLSRFFGHRSRRAAVGLVVRRADRPGDAAALSPRVRGRLGRPRRGEQAVSQHGRATRWPRTSAAGRADDGRRGPGPQSAGGCDRRAGRADSAGDRFHPHLVGRPDGADRRDLCDRCRGADDLRKPLRPAAQGHRIAARSARGQIDLQHQAPRSAGRPDHGSSGREWPARSSRSTRRPRMPRRGVGQQRGWLSRLPRRAEHRRLDLAAGAAVSPSSPSWTWPKRWPRSTPCAGPFAALLGLLVLASVAIFVYTLAVARLASAGPRPPNCKSSGWGSTCSAKRSAPAAWARFIGRTTRCSAGPRPSS